MGSTLHAHFWPRTAKYNNTRTIDAAWARCHDRTGPCTSDRTLHLTWCVFTYTYNLCTALYAFYFDPRTLVLRGVRVTGVCSQIRLTPTEAMQIEQSFKSLASVSGLPVQLYDTRFQQYIQKDSGSIVQQIEQMAGSCSRTQKKKMAATHNTSYYSFPLSFHHFCLSCLADLLEGVLYCYSSSYSAILALPVHLAALLKSVLMRPLWCAIYH
jgi:hypothetical protein